MIRCRKCGTEVPEASLACPLCHALTHAQELETLAREAARARKEGDPRGEIEAWRRALELLPETSGQAVTVAARVSELSQELDRAGSGTGPAHETDGGGKAGWGAAAVGGVALVAWKFKALIVILLIKGKLLLLGATKWSTLAGMLLSFGVYWTAFGWAFALGLVVSIYIHEMGHVSALRHYGIQASAPMFVPGLGAFVRLGQRPADAREDARIGLAGPIWGLGAALAAAGVFAVTGAPIWGAIARVGAWINLFNLLPVWQLDGARGFRALDRSRRWVLTALMGGLWLWTHEGMLLLLLIVAAWRSLAEPGAEKPDRRTFVEFAVLLAALSALCTLPVPL